MPYLLTENKSFDKCDFREKPLTKGEFDHCTFTGCDFSDSDLSEFVFSECTFQQCNLSNVRLFKTAFRDASFLGCKLLGLRFDTCTEFGLQLRFEDCILNYASFFGLSLKKTVFNRCSMQETDLSECNLTQASFEQVDLSRATFDNTNLTKADFRTALHFSINPSRNVIKKARFSAQNLTGLLDAFGVEIEP